MKVRMFRKTVWRKCVSDVIQCHQDRALNTTIFILREFGPVGFLLQEDQESKQYKVSRRFEWRLHVISWRNLTLHIKGVFRWSTHVHLSHLPERERSVWTHLLVKFNNNIRLGLPCFTPSYSIFTLHYRILMRKFRLPRDHECKSGMRILLLK